MSEFAIVHSIDLEQEENGVLLLIETETTKFRFLIPDADTAEELYAAARREIGPWLYERDLARAAMPFLGNTPYEITDPKHPRHHDVMAEASDL